MVGVRWCFGIAFPARCPAKQITESPSVAAMQTLVQESQRAGGRLSYGVAVAIAIAMKVVGPRNTQTQVVLSSSPPKPVPQIHWRFLSVPGESVMLNNSSK